MEGRIDGKTELIGLMAYPIRHTSSPTMQNEAFRALGYNYAYLAFEVEQDQLKDAVQAIRALRMRGSNVSMPNKTVVHQYLDHLSPAAELTGSVNTIVNDNGVLTGYVTDGIGFMGAVKDQGVNIIGEKITVVGTGGASTAICIQAALDGVKEISIFGRKDAFWEKGESIRDKINKNTKCKAVLYDLADLPRLKAEIADSVLFVNATSVGMHPQEGVTYIPDSSYFPKDVVVMDVVYAPRVTKTMELAKEAGCKTFNGLDMMLFQGSAAFELWTGEPMPIEHMKKFLGIEPIEGQDQSEEKQDRKVKVAV